MSAPNPAPAQPAAPRFSADAGFHAAGINVALTTETAGARLYYTLDGSPPSAASTRYQSPIAIDTTTVVRAVAVDARQRPGAVSTRTFFIGEERNLPTFSLATDPANLWNVEAGIYVLGDDYEEEYPFRGANVWNDWERPVHVEFFERDGRLGFDLDAGAKIHGASSRLYGQKSLAIFLRREYGTGRLSYPLFPDSRVREFESFLLRSSGSDWNVTMFRDAMMTGLVAGLGIDRQDYRPAVVFINGAYWGIHNIREKVNEHFIASHHDVEPDSLDLLESDGRAIHGSNVGYSALVRLIERQDMGDPARFAQVADAVDLQNLTDYQIAQIYYGNTDWPGKNIKFWRDNRGGGKWRWILYDTDFGFAKFVETDHNTVAHNLQPAKAGGRNPLWSTLVIRELLENDEFRRQFISRFADHLNSTFHHRRVVEVIDAMRAEIAPEIPRHLARWGHFRAQPYYPPHLPQISDLEPRWEANVQVLRDFAAQRGGLVRSHLMEHFALADSVAVSVGVDPPGAGALRVNGWLRVEAPWQGVYFAGEPLRLDLVARPGYEFDHWRGVEAESAVDVVVVPTGDLGVTAVLREVRDAEGPVVINELDPDAPDAGDWVELFNRGNAFVDLGGWVLRDSGGGEPFVLPQGTMLGPRGYVVLCRDVARFSRAFPEVDAPLGDFDFGLRGAGETVVLLDERGGVRDSLTYGGGAWPVNVGGAATLALADPGIDNAVSVHWFSADPGTPGAPNDAVVPAAYFLGANFPNPFNSTTLIRFGLPQGGEVKVEVFDLLGQKVRTLVDGYRGAAVHRVQFDGGGLASGVYFYRLQTAEAVVARKMTLIR